MNLQGLQQIPCLVTSGDNMLQIVHPQDDHDIVYLFHPPVTKVYSCTSPDKQTKGKDKEDMSMKNSLIRY